MKCFLHSEALQNLLIFLSVTNQQFWVKIHSRTFVIGVFLKYVSVPLLVWLSNSRNVRKNLQNHQNFFLNVSLWYLTKVLTKSNLLSQKHASPVLLCITESERNPSGRKKRRPCYLTMADSNLHEQNNNWDNELTARGRRLRFHRHILTIENRKINK